MLTTQGNTLLRDNTSSQDERLRRAEAILEKVRLKEGEKQLTEEEILEECRLVRQERYAEHHGQAA